MIETKKGNRGERTKTDSDRPEKMLKRLHRRWREKNTDKLYGEMWCWFKMMTSSVCPDSSNTPTGLPTYITHTATADTGYSPQNALYYSEHGQTQKQNRHHWLALTYQQKVSATYQLSIMTVD